MRVDLINKGKAPTEKDYYQDSPEITSFSEKLELYAYS